MTAPSTCTVSGTIYSAAGAALEGQLVRFRVLPYDDLTTFLLEYPPMDWVPTTSTAPVEVESNSSGEWSITVPQGAVVQVYIPSLQINHAGAIPSSATAVLSDLGLYRVR